ncbi:MAG: hypothetical protein K8S56_02410 [Candidatus Cloacimonetes bacterium]|nr:hypothetical protein [Candidatus Cloacimonadota bacterium]
MSWETATLSSTTSIAAIDSEINQLTSGNWNDKISLAKKIIGRDLENKLTRNNYSVDEAGGDVLLDIIANPQSLDLSSDYLTLHLIYADLAITLGRESYWQKAEFYRQEYGRHLNTALQALNIDCDGDGNPEKYRANLFTSGRINRS